MALWLSVVGSITGCRDGQGEVETPTLRIFAAASLRNVAEDLGEAFRQLHGVEVLINSAGSNTLAQQIQATDGADLFISADRQWVDFLEERQRTATGTRRDVLSNRMVVVARKDATYGLQSVEDLGGLPFRHLALADPEGVPAGRYARAYLQTARASHGGASTLWDGVAERVVPTLDVRAALALSESDPEILAMVYHTDALQSDAVQVLMELPVIPEVSIAYCAVVIEGATQEDAARRFLKFLSSETARTIVDEHGFLAL